MDKKQEKLLQVLIKKTGVSAEMALHHLQEHQYKVNIALKSIEKELYTPTELILRKYKDKEAALNELHTMLIEKHQISYEYWLKFKHLKDLPSEIQCLLIVVEWLNYESFEDFEIALFFQLEYFTQQIEENFLLNKLANSLRNVKNIVFQIYEKNKNNKRYNISEELWRNQQFQECESLFRSQRGLIIDRLYDLVKTNIDKFP